MNVRRLRESLATFAREANLPADELEAMAKAMSHSRQTADRHYDLTNIGTTTSMITTTLKLQKKARRILEENRQVSRTDVEEAEEEEGEDDGIASTMVTQPSSPSSSDYELCLLPNCPLL